MKKQELKIGDWVEYINHPVRVNSIEDGIIGIETIVGSETEYYHSKHCDIDAIKPIPLTKEILEKNDCMKLPNSFVLERGNLSFNIRQNEDSIWEINLIYGISFVPIANLTSVHQLQHLLWALGINDNLEV